MLKLGASGASLAAKATGLSGAISPVFGLGEVAILGSVAENGLAEMLANLKLSGSGLYSIIDW
jgi:hypothetical protein